MSKGKRQSLSQKTRFEVFKRDSFRCQYCGRSAPDVVLEVDHIKPRKEGGNNHNTNLITSCRECNQGKGARLLDDQYVLQKQKEQLEELNERRNQLEMMMMWREELVNLSERELEIAEDYFAKLTGYQVTDKGSNDFRKCLKRYGLNTLLDSIEKSVNQYSETDKRGLISEESVAKIYKYIFRICKFENIDKEKPYLKDLFYIRGILRNRLNYCDLGKALISLERAYLQGASIESLKDLALSVKNWTKFMEEISEFLERD